MKKMTVLLSIIILASCNLEGSNSDGSPGGDSGNQTNLSSFYDREPDTSICYEGILKPEEKIKVLNTLNQIRQIHKLKPVTYSYVDDIYTSKSALISAANAKLDHNPNVDFKCWTTEGQLGSQTSNLHLAYPVNSSKLDPSDEAIISFLIDQGVESLGHRRWLLDPFLDHVSFGRVDGKSLVGSGQFVSGMNLKVINQQKAEISETLVEFIAYPYEDYPHRYFKHGEYLSFSVLADKADFWGNQNVDFSKASVQVITEDGVALGVSAIRYNNQAFGIPNALQWQVNSTVNGKKYLVKIQNVKVSSRIKDYEYWFRVN